MVDIAHETRRLTARAASGAAWLSFENSALQGLSLLLFMVLARFVSAKDFGLISICFIMTQSLRTLVQEKIPEAISIKASANPQDWTTAFWMSACIAAVLSTLMYFSAGSIEAVLGEPGLASAMRSMSLIVLSCGFGRTHEAWLLRNFRFKSLALRGIGGSIVGGVAGVYWAANGGGVYALVLQQVAGNLVSLALLWISCPWRPQGRPVLTVAYDIAAYTRDVSVGALVYVINQNCDTFLVLSHFGPGAAGYYSVAKRLRWAIQLVTLSPINGVLLPTIAEARIHPELCHKIVGHALRATSLICAPVFLGAALVSRDAIVFLFGQKWSEAGLIFTALSIGGVGTTLQAFNSTIFVTCRKPRWPGYFAVAETLLAILCFYLMASVFGQAGIGIAFVAPLALSVPVAAILAMRLLGLTTRDWLIWISPGVLPATVMLLVGLPIATLFSGLTAVTRGSITIVIGLLLFVTLLRLIDRSAWEQGRSLGAYIMKRFLLYAI